METVNICYSTDLRGCNHLITSIYSVISNNSINIDFHIIHKELTEDAQMNIKKIFDSFEKCNIYFYSISLDRIRNSCITVGLPVESLFRVLIPEVLPQYLNRVLYLDIDVICVSNILNMYNLDFDSSFLCAVADDGIQDNYIIELGSKIEYGYFNSGVILVNIQKWKECHFSDIVLNVLQTRNLKATDQDALNIACEGNWKSIPCNFNYMTPRVFKDMSFYGKTSTLNNSKPCFIHFVGPQKPWDYLCSNPYKYTYDFYRKTILGKYHKCNNISLSNMYNYLKNIKNCF